MRIALHVCSTSLLFVHSDFLELPNVFHVFASLRDAAVTGLFHVVCVTRCVRVQRSVSSQ